MNHEAVTAALNLAPLIRELRGDTETNRRIPQRIVERLIDARLCRIAIAAELDGLALPPAEALDVYEALSGAEASVGWIVWNNSLPCLLGRFLDADARASIFSDCNALYANSTRPTGKAVARGDAFKISGRWSLVSGCELAEWVALMCVVHEGDAPKMAAPDAPELRVAYVPRGDFEIVDTWYVGGLRGTGSQDVVVDDVLVPETHTLSPMAPATLDGPLGQLPIIVTMAAGFGAQTLGIAQAALDTLVALGGKVSPDGGPGLRDRAAVQDLLARQTAAVAAARAYLHERVGVLWAEAERGARAPLEDIATTWAAAHHAVDVAKTTVEGAYASAGATALYTSCPLERAHRDLHAMLRHVVSQPFWIENAGRVQLGLEPQHPLFAL